MQLQYFYYGQVERMLKFLIRTFSNFQIVSHTDSAGNTVYKQVPCRYYQYSRQSLYQMNRASENMLQSAPFITLHLDNLTIDRSNVRSPVQQSIVTGVNAKQSDGSYINTLASQNQVTRYNPIPWSVDFSLHVWTTTQTSKFELFEQIVTLFNPSIHLQLSSNPVDWTSGMTVELVDCDFASNSFPTGQSNNEDIDVMALKFKTTIWLSLPAIQNNADLINTIVANISSETTSDADITFNSNAISTDLFTPSSCAIQTKQIGYDTLTETHEITLDTKYFNVLDDNGCKLSWAKYFQYYEPNYKAKTISIRFCQTTEDQYPVIAEVVNIGSGDTCNILTVRITLDQGNTTSIVKFVSTSDDFNTLSVGDVVCALEPGSINGVAYDQYDLITKTDTTWTVAQPTETEYLYCEADNSHYKFFSSLGVWARPVMTQYKAGLWKIGFTN